MAKLIGKDQLCRTDLDYFKSLQGISEKTLFQRYSSLENIVKNNIDVNYQEFLAYPVQEGNTITFYGKKYNQTPQLLTELHGDELIKYQNIKEQTLAHYCNKIESLKNSSKTTEAEFLSDATKYINDQFVYCYDDRVILGVWGMQLKDNYRKSIGNVVKNLFVKKPIPLPDPSPPIFEEPTVARIEDFNICFKAGDFGTLNGISEFQIQTGGYVSDNEIPIVEPKEGYEFMGWDKDPANYKISENTDFTAQYREIVPPPPPLPWYKRFWDWLRSLFFGKGCLKSLLWLLLILLLLLLLWWLFRSCNREHLSGGGALGNNDSTWVKEDPRVGDGGGIYDPNNPYEPVPTPEDSGYREVLPPNQGVLPPIDTTEIIRKPGNPSIIGNRLNILMENEDKSIMDFAKVFKTKYPDNKYKVVYYDNVVKRIQIEIPPEEREQLKKEIPGKFTPEYELFVFDEALFEGVYNPKDPAFSDKNKAWYLHTIKAPKAWDITRGSEKIVVAIVDNGFNLSHPELKSKVVSPYNVWTHSTAIFPQKIDHGTHVAGTALALADNDKGICGIAPSCRFMPVQVADKSGIMTTTSLLDGVLYALYQGADVINISLGTSFNGLNAFPPDFQQDLIKNHFKEEERLWREIMRIAANHKSTIVVAAGNDNVLAGIDAMQRPELIVTVSAVDKNNQNYNKANFSNYGSYSAISAPGVGIYSTVGSNGYETMDGTSMAAPIITGSIALMKSLNDSLTTKQIICILQNTGLITQGNIGKLVQLDKALAKVKSGDISNCKETPKPSTGEVQIFLSWNNYNDLDLICTDPDGQTIWYKNKNVPSGGQLEIDMNVENKDSKNPIENIYWSTGAAPVGTYNVYLQFYRKHESTINNTPYTIKVKYGDKMETYKGVIKKEDNTLHICSFTLGNGYNSQKPDPDTPDNEKKNNLLKERERLQQELDRINSELKKFGNHIQNTKKINV
jgi:subtilisin family serine protease